MSKHEGIASGRAFEIPKRKKVTGKHKPPTEFVRGQALKIDAKFGDKAMLRYRHVDQSERFMESDVMEVPAEYTNSPFALMYYFVVGGSMYPGLDATLSNRPYFVVRAH